MKEFAIILLFWSATSAAQTSLQDGAAPSTAADTIPATAASETESDAQDDARLTIIPPALENWTVIPEGETRNLQLSLENFTGKVQKFELIEGKEAGASLDSTGYFSWTPSYDLVGRLEGEKTFTMLFEAAGEEGEPLRKSLELSVRHVNRPPVVGELRNFYVKYNADNQYQIDLNAVTDPDNDPLVFRSIPAIMPEGARLSESGLFTWRPSLRQFNRLKNDPIRLSFIVEDQPANAQVKGQFNILVTQMDLPPQITMIPSVNRLSARENETVNIKFFLSDPNGDEDIAEFGLLSDDSRITSSELVENAKTQWEFVWEPGYEFVREVEDSIAVEVDFFVVDQSHLRDERKVRFTVINTENQEKVDQTLYAQYRSSLLRVWDLLKQLEEKEEEYYKKLRKARRGKTNLAITDASLGAITGLSPFVIEDQKSKEVVAGVGGTTVMTIGTLEAADVIAKSPTALIQNLNKIIEKKNELLMHGNVYARRYATALTRREDDFQRDTDDLLTRLILKDVATLELDAGWTNPEKASDKNLRDYFPDFVADPEL